MHQYPLHEPGVRTQWIRSDRWSWRHGATLVLIGVSAPVFLVGAIVAGVVAVPMLLWTGARHAGLAARAQAGH